MIETIPLPVTDDPVDRAFWQACLEGRLLVQRCGDCGHVQHPPRAMCPVCRSMELGWSECVGTGTIWSFTVPRPPLLPAFAGLVPYVVVIVEPDDFPGIRIVGALAGIEGNGIGGIDPETIAIGGPVRLTFVSLADDVALPCWAPVAADGSLEKDAQQ
ncbi:Zn-ribbon domain-containing OB-fold protein [Parasphingopyxis marina]|uniref:OB-fold domain-containing protein n=1 Tax=Parasphingopyxis marina TaxID=2761622 RepID=A0A842HXS0_9SPHN|nr:zinc ribbon domain-containing protein [Parasphingopyxis marina]MBC2778968.1 OB-fold domain-containing protein [Parasphingopyxis marina]